MTHIVNFCPGTKLDGVLKLDTADKVAVAWLDNACKS